ncbi:hypothetical protein KGM_207489 [Danaus plexippus plexippus]|uniref:Uncharacterized protein n=1 Tax=Danaus plexippus plexippus TaxID=278856 RepID=A0A212FHD7_DANPL|nr:hypothetical protein KGM_207489 [Danaus plexippus plexippus]
MTMKSLKYSEREDMMEGFSPVPPPLPRRQPVRNIYAEPFVDPSVTQGREEDNIVEGYERSPRRRHGPSVSLCRGRNNIEPRVKYDRPGIR